MCLLSDGEMNYLIVCAFGLQNDTFGKPHFRGKLHGEYLHRKPWYCTLHLQVTLSSLNNSWLASEGHYYNVLLYRFFFYYSWPMLPPSLHNPNHLCRDSKILCPITKSGTCPCNQFFCVIQYRRNIQKPKLSAILHCCLIWLGICTPDPNAW